MDFPTHIDTISMGLPIVYFKVLQIEFSKLWCVFSLKVVLILANTANLDEIHLGIHCLPKYPFRGFQYTMG